MSSLKTVQILEQRDKDNDYIARNYNKLSRDYNNKFIAVKNQKVVACDSDFKKVLAEVKKKKINPAMTVTRFVFKEGHEFIL